MVLRIRSLKELGKNVKLAAGFEENPKRTPVPRAKSIPQARLFELVSARYPDAEEEKRGLVPKRRFEVDIVIERLKLVIEIDGWEFHGKYLSGFVRDREKDRLLLLEGYRTVRFTAGEVLKDPTSVMGILDKVVKVIEGERDNGKASDQ